MASTQRQPNGTAMPETWLTCPQPNPRAALRLFCLPYAGGNTSIFRTWPHDLAPNIETHLVKLPGRESRLGEPPIDCLTTLVQALAQAMQPYLGRPFALFGHSMGALISFELARHLFTQYGHSPTRLYVSGFRAPQLPGREAPIYHLPEAEFVTAIRRFDGTPEGVLRNAELMKLMLPILRADFTIIETYVYRDAPPLDCRISAFGGLQDGVVSREQLSAWSVHTRAGFDLHMVPGNHFFLHSARPLVLWSIAQDLIRQPGLQAAARSCS